MRIYISGAMKNGPHHQARFAKAEEVLRTLYPEAAIVNPTDLKGSLTQTLGAEHVAAMTEPDFLLCDLRNLSTCTHIAHIPRSCASSGAMTEMFFARAMGIPSIDLRDSFEEGVGG